VKKQEGTLIIELDGGKYFRIENSPLFRQFCADPGARFFKLIDQKALANGMVTFRFIDKAVVLNITEEK